MLRIGALTFVKPRGSADLKPADLVIHARYGIGPVTTFRGNRVVVNFFDGGPQTVPPDELGIVHCAS